MLYDVVKNYERQGIDVPELTLVFLTTALTLIKEGTMTQECKVPPILKSYLKDH
jgi:hypothetical protein